MAYVRIPEIAWRIVKGSEVMYLTDLWFTKTLAEKYTAIIQTEPTTRFYQFIADQMNLVLEGKSIDPAIEPTILNMIDDKMNNRKIALRTGDYISLQKCFQQKNVK